MGLLDRLRRYLGDEEPQRPRDGYAPRYDSFGAPAAAPRGSGRPAGGADDAAVERYRSLLRTAPPDAVEEVHAEAFAALTPEQRRSVFAELSSSASAADRPASDDPRALARSATRSELRRPGFLERSLGAGGGGGGLGRGPGLGTATGGSLLGTVAGVVVGSAIADAVLPGIGDLGSDLAGGVQDVAGGFDGDGVDASGADGGFDAGGSGGGGDFGGGDIGGGDL